MNTETNQVERIEPDEVDDYLTELTLVGWSRATKRKLLNVEIANEVRALMPVRLQLYHEWELVYGMEQHGTSLQTLYQNCDPTVALRRKTSLYLGSDEGFMGSEVKRVITTGNGADLSPLRRNGYVMVIKDHAGNIFGAYLNEYLRPVESRRFYGNGECFLWKCSFVAMNQYEGADGTVHHTVHSNTEKTMQFKAFPYTGENDFLIYSNRNSIAIGSGGTDNLTNQFGLWIDADIENGYSHPCLTFGNECLSDAGKKFKIYGLEVWRVGS
ncbi:hypothetical protein BABINDRAFT_172514 [Babjeviella inositovora NRRL Y-12698]|uniref:Oxidation resistance protein 1 n=1 Tax=Babjeviella inositovora NRRL Y-12698 TaxID=984486 RepID=A0A1E3QK50_9ASCO|nr:uncharacterized protein BABINDRAFT_172514 [Babjeviella inositovora NRRL Y-12698]ODQ78069.1 hypothetical protein BABINDRAFT_172514 [Babjeviella inositovora NRRL Y-12698]